MPKQKLNYESRIDLAKQRIRDNPQRAMQEIGKFLVKEIKANTPKSLGKRLIKNKKGELIQISPGKLKSSFSYWYRKKEGDLQIGSKSFYASFVELGTSQHAANAFFVKTIEDNIQVIQDLIAESLKELNKE